MVTFILLQALVSQVVFAAPATTINFEPYYEHKKEKVVVELAKVESEPPWIRGTFELDVSADKVAAVLTDFANYGKTFSSFMTQAKVLEKGERYARLHIIWPYKWISDRDGVARYSYEKDKQGATTVSWKSDSKPGDPTSKKLVRIKLVEGSTKVAPLGKDRCRIVYTYRGDLGGKFPKSSRRKAWRGQSVVYRKAILDRLKALGSVS